MGGNRETRASTAKWAARPVASRVVSGVAAVSPVLCGVAGALLVAKLLPSPTTVGASIMWWSILAAGTILPVIVCAKFARRLLPLALLLELTMLFPDEAPSRLSIARQAGRTRDLKKRVAELHELGEEGESTRVAEAVLELIAHLGTHDRRTRGHSEKVRALTDMLAEEYGLSPEDRDKLRWGALLHDIGKLTVAPVILNKPGLPDEAEWATLKRHPAEGARIAEPLWAWLGSWMGAIAQHHEKFDGTGYPYGLAGREISLGGRIVAVADSYETMTATRPYKKPMSVGEARAELVRSAGSHFDPVVVRKFLAISSRRLWVAAGLAALLAQLPVLGGLWTRGFVTRVGRNVVSAASAAAVVAALGVGGFIGGTQVTRSSIGNVAESSEDGSPNPLEAATIELLRGWRAGPDNRPDLAVAAIAGGATSRRAGAIGSPPAPSDGGGEPPSQDPSNDPPAEPQQPQDPDSEPFVAHAEITGANPLSRQIAGVTQTDFEAECRVPLSQGLDGWVFGLPTDVSAGGGTAVVSGDNSAGDHDLDLFFYSDSCRPLGSLADPGSDESGALPQGTAYVVVNEASNPGTAVTLTIAAAD